MKKTEAVAPVFEADGALYPPKMKRAGKLARLRKWILFCLLFGCAICVLVNALVGGFPWSPYVLLSSYVFYGVFVTRSLVDASFMQKLATSVLSASALLLLIQYLGGGLWAVDTVVPMVLSCGIAAAALFCLFNIAAQRRYLLPLFLLLIAGFVMPFVFVGIIGYWSWANITLLSTPTAVIIASVAFFRKPLFQEIKKIFSAS